MYNFLSQFPVYRVTMSVHKKSTPLLSSSRVSISEKKRLLTEEGKKVSKEQLLRQM